MSTESPRDAYGVGSKALLGVREIWKNEVARLWMDRRNWPETDARAFSERLAVLYVDPAVAAGTRIESPEEAYAAEVA